MTKMLLGLLVATVGLAPAGLADEEPQENVRLKMATGFLDQTVTVGDETYRYNVYVPPDYTPEKAWPMVLFLHGSGERGRDGLLQTEVGIGRAIRRQRERFPAIVVMPQCRENDAWWSGAMTQMVLGCVNQTARAYRLDPERLYLTGLSLGGGGAWWLGAVLPERFAAIVPICAIGETRMGVQESLIPRLAQTPIWCFHGESDTRVPVKEAHEMVEGIKQAGGEIKYTEFPGGNHFIWDRVYDDPKVWEWVFAQRRPGASSEVVTENQGEDAEVEGGGAGDERGDE
jgi:predicted peptidase